MWTPTYDVQVRDGTTARTATVNITNGNKTSSDKIVSPTGSAVFNISRVSLDKPIFISASIDGRDSDFFSVPARPQYDLVLKAVKADYGPIRRSGQFGPEAASAPFCLPDPEASSQYLPETAKKYVTGAGLDWQNRSSIDFSVDTPLSVCAIVSSAGVACTEDKCYHETTGHLNAILASTVKISYSN
jgi:hypothetical protein